MKNIFLLSILATTLSGCGTPAQSIGTTIANSETVEVFYENNCSSCYSNAVSIATSHCSRYGKNPIPARKSYMTIDGIGRTVTTFICK
jgi:hypothetical protein